jgi:hypothetical protein
MSLCLLGRSAVVAVAVAAAVSVAACSNPPDEEAGRSGASTTIVRSEASSTTVADSTTTMPAVASTGPSTPVPPVATSPPAKATVELRGDDLAVTSVGAPFREGVDRVSAALGRPSADPTPETSCVHAEVEVEWNGFRLAGGHGKVSGWLSTRRDLTTPSAVTVGTTVSVLRRVYGDRLVLVPPNPDAGWTFAVRGVNVFGALSGSSGPDRVRSLFNGDCSPP